MKLRLRILRLWACGALHRLRDTVLANPFEFPIALTLFLVAVVFTLFPEVLEHTAISFEQRGVIHHWGFHYPLLFGSAAMVAGLLMHPPPGFIMEFAGLVLVFLALMLNLTAMLADELAGGEPDASGLGIAIRAALMIGIATRAWIIVKRPTITVAARRDA